MGAAVGGSEVVSGGRRKRHPMSDINVTPLVDVMLVLLIIFIVAAQDEGKAAASLTLPRAKGDNDQSIEQTVVNATLAKVDNQVMVIIDGNKVDINRVEDDLPKYLRNYGGAVLNLNADKDLPCEHVVRTLAAARENGIKSVRIAVEVGEN